MSMLRHSFPHSSSLGDVQKYANMKGWRVIKATWTRGTKPKKVKKSEFDGDEYIQEKPAFEVKSHWNLFYTQTI